MTGRPRGGREGGARQDDEMAALLEPIVSHAGFDLEAVTVGSAGRRKVVKVVVDGDDGVSLDDIAVIARAASDVLDGADGGFGSGPYTLEVTSPGVDRPLTTERHWRRAIGRLVRFSADGKPTEARVESVDGERVTLVQGEDRSTHALEAVSPARVQVEFTSKRTPSED